MECRSEDLIPHKVEIMDAVAVLALIALILNITKKR